MNKENEVLPLEDHIEILSNGEAHEVPCEKYTDEDFTLPPWFNEEKYKRGQKYIADNIFSQFTCTLSGLICVLSIPSILEILEKTHKSSTTLTAYRRYVSTIFHVYCWYTEELKPGTSAWKSLIAVRTRHFRSSMVSKSKGNGHISQRDLAYTQFGFFGLGFLCSEKLGMVPKNKEEVEGYIHFWRTIGYMIGIHDRYNICRSSLEETKVVCEHIRKNVYCVNLQYPPEYFHFMVKSLVDGMWYYSPSLSEGSFLYYTYWLTGINDYPLDSKMEYFKIKLKNPCENKNQINNNNAILKDENKGSDLSLELGWYNKFLLRMLLVMHTSWLSTTFGRMYLNGQTYVTIFLLKYFPFLSFWYLGITNSLVNMFSEDIAQYAQPIPNREMFLMKKY